MKRVGQYRLYMSDYHKFTYSGLILQGQQRKKKLAKLEIYSKKENCTVKFKFEMAEFNYKAEKTHPCISKTVYKSAI